MAVERRRFRRLPPPSARTDVRRPRIRSCDLRAKLPGESIKMDGDRVQVVRAGAGPAWELIGDRSEFVSNRLVVAGGDFDGGDKSLFVVVAFPY